MLSSHFKTMALACALAGSALITGCASQQTQPMYNWSGYQPELYAYFKADDTSAQEQLIVLEKNKQQTEQTAGLLPPGYRAHMGLLYATSGQMDQAKLAFESEKQHFPESTQFMDFLLGNFAKLQNEGGKQ